jgi:DNA-binding PadR family transcriptional regulator
LGAGTPMRDGRRRRFYRLEPEGLRALNESRAAIDRLWRGVRLPLKGHV